MTHLTPGTASIAEALRQLYAIVREFGCGGMATVYLTRRKVILHLRPLDSARVERACPFAFQESRQ
jgi:hypothetical protein